MRVGSVTERQVNRRRNLLSTSALDVEYVIYASSPEQAGTIASRIAADTRSGALAVLARDNGLTSVTSTTSVQEPLTMTESPTFSVHHFERSVFLSIPALLLLA